MVGMGMGQHQVLQVLNAGLPQGADQRVLGLRRSGVDQAVVSILPHQDRVALAHIQHGNRRLGIGQQCRVGPVGSDSKDIVEIRPGRYPVPAAVILYDKTTGCQQQSGHRTDQPLPAVLGFAAAPALTLRRTGHSVSAPPTGHG